MGRDGDEKLHKAAPRSVRPCCPSFLLRGDTGNQEKVTKQWVQELALARRGEDCAWLSWVWFSGVCGLDASGCSHPLPDAAISPESPNGPALELHREAYLQLLVKAASTFQCKY